MKTILCVVLLAVLLECSCQSDNCDTVDAGLAPVLGACRESARSCVQQPRQDFNQFNELFCNANVQNAFDNFLTCTNRTFSDQVFGAICGNLNCSRDEVPDITYAECRQSQGRCFETVFDNDGTAAFEACMCASETQDPATPTCSDECRMELEQLVSDVGCCVNTALYAYYFSTCGDPGNPSLQVLNNLYDACDVDLPSTCLTPFSLGGDGPTEDAQAIASVFSVLMFFTILSFLFIN